MTDEKQLKLFKKDLRSILEDNFVDLFTKLHQKILIVIHGQMLLHLINDLNLNPKIYVNLDIQENGENKDLTKWLKAVL